jgi:TldD protein
LFYLEDLNRFEKKKWLNMDRDARLEIPVDDITFKKLQKLKKENGIQYFNVRFSAGISNSLSINKGNMKRAHLSNGFGFSVQTLVDGENFSGYGFTVSNVITPEEIEKRFIESAKLAKFSAQYAEEKFKIKDLDPIKAKYIQPQKIDLLNTSQEEKIKTLLQQDLSARQFDKRIVNTNSVYSDSVTREIIYTSDDRLIDSTESYARMLIFAYSQEKQITQSARASVGLTGGFEVADMAKNIGGLSAQRAIEMLKSKPVKGGKYNVVIDPLLGGTFIHEAFGHACEADAVLEGQSQLEGKIGSRVGKDFINVFDDPTVEHSYGFVKYDSEGIEAKKVQLIKEGVLNAYMHSRETASRMNVEPTGNGRAQAYSSTPIVRMSNTILTGGNMNLEELLQDLKNGILCVNWNYGYTDPSVGNFMFKMERAWKIENGEKTQLLRDAALSGIMLEALDKITGLSKDIEFDDGTCGKSGQHVPVCSGGPYLRMNDVVIGGM